MEVKTRVLTALPMGVTFSKRHGLTEASAWLRLMFFVLISQDGSLAPMRFASKKIACVSYITYDSA